MNRCAPRAVFRIEAHASPQYSANLPALAQDIAQMKERGTAVVIYAGSRAEKLCAALSSLGCEMALAPWLNRSMVEREAIILAQGLRPGL